MKAIDAKHKTQENRQQLFDNSGRLRAELQSILTLIEKAVDEGLNFTTYVVRVIDNIIIEHLKVDLGYNVSVDEFSSDSKVYVYISWY